jgi:hypothetical protein
LGTLSRNLSGWSIGFIDYNNDGWKDIYSANGDVDNLAATSRQHDTMFENIDGKTLRDVTAEMGPDFAFRGYQRGSVFVDLNNDGFLDLVVTSLGEKPRILMNNALNGNHWIMFDLRGRMSNRNGIGATINVTTGSGRSLFNHVTTSVGFMSSSDRRAHFGLGAEAKIDHVEIRWPSGILQRIDHPAVDQILKVDEPAADRGTDWRSAAVVWRGPCSLCNRVLSALHDRQNLIGLHLGQHLPDSGGPGNLNPLDRCGLAQAEVYPLVAG